MSRQKPAIRRSKAHNAALDELRQWMSEFKMIAKIALARAPQLFEALQFGVVA